MGRWRWRERLYTGQRLEKEDEVRGVRLEIWLLRRLTILAALTAQILEL